MELAEKLVVLYSLFGVSMCSGPYSVTLPQSVEAVNGLCVLINCSFTIDNQFDDDLQNNPKGIWRKDGTEDDKTVFDSTTPESNKIKGRITGDLQKKDCTTIFNRISKNDTGTYYFRIDAGPVLKYTYQTPVSITVRDLKPTLSLYRDQTEVEDQRVLEGSSVSLLCFAYSPCPTQLPTLTWSPLPINTSQQQIQNTSFTSSQLNFIATHLHHGLRFNCTAAYQLDKNSKTAQRSLILRVLYPPKNTSVSVSPSGPVMLGSSLSLNCSSDGNPAVNYTWYRQNGEQIGTGPSLTIRTDDTHRGLYCRAHNQHGAQNSSVQLDIQYAPRNTNVSVSPPGPVVLGSSVSLNCSSNGNPAVSYTWYRQNGEQIGTRASLTIKIDDTHSGLYCRAQNQHGAQNSSVQLDIQYAPRNTSVSVSSSGPVVLGSSVSLTCSSDGNPAVNYTWYREEGEQMGTGPSLTINNTENTHSSLYCRAQNQHGAQNTSAQLDIQYGPQISLSSNCNTSSEGVIQCVCEVHGRPVPKVEWLLSGQPIPPSLNSFIREESVGRTGLRSVLSMHLSLTEMPGLLCISTNKLGSTSQLFSFVTTGQYSEYKATTVPYVILAALLLLCVIIIGFLLFKLKQLSAKTKALKVEGDTYASLQLSAQSSDYETLQPNRERKLKENKS